MQKKQPHKETSESRDPYEDLGLAAEETAESLRKFGDAVREALPYYKPSLRDRLEIFLDTLLSWNPIGLAFESVSWVYRSLFPGRDNPNK